MLASVINSIGVRKKEKGVIIRMLESKDRMRLGLMNKQTQVVEHKAGSPLRFCS